MKWSDAPSDLRTGDGQPILCKSYWWDDATRVRTGPCNKPTTRVYGNDEGGTFFCPECAIFWGDREGST